MSLCQCPYYHHSLYTTLNPLGLGFFDHVIHIGAHDGIEADIYDHWGSKVDWFECNPLVFEDLLFRIRGRKNHYAHQIALWSDKRELEFHLYRDRKDGASSFFLPDKMFDYIKDCPLIGEKIVIKTEKFDDYCLENLIDFSSCDFLNIDVQGAEMEVFKGAESLLRSPKLKYIWCEVSWDNVYKDAPIMSDIDDYLSKFGFSRYLLRKDWEIHGDALYTR